MDRSRVSGGGVTAGLDFGPTLLAELCGEQVAKMTQLSMGYDPKSAFDCGTSEAAGLELTRLALTWVQEVDDQHQETAQAARARLALA